MSTEKRKIYVVNDDQAILSLFEELLGEEGFEVYTSRFQVSTQVLHEQIRSLSPDMVIMDFLIGEEAMGWQLLQLMKMDRQTRDIRAIVCSAAVKILNDLQPHLQAMNVQVVLKPFDIDHLLGVIDTMWEKPGAPLSIE